MNCRLLELIIIIIGSILIPVGNWIIKKRKEKKETNKEIYHSHFKFDYTQLFEEEKHKNKNCNPESELFISHTDNYNIPEIIFACNIIVEFSKKGNMFKFKKVNSRFKQLKKVCDNLVNLTKHQFFVFENVEDDSGHERIYHENKIQFRLFQDNFVHFYKSIFQTY